MNTMVTGTQGIPLASVPLISSIFSHLLRHFCALFKGRDYRQSHRIQGRILSRHIFRHTLWACIIIDGRVSVSIIILSGLYPDPLSTPRDDVVVC